MTYIDILSLMKFILIENINCVFSIKRNRIFFLKFGKGKTQKCFSLPNRKVLKAICNLINLAVSGVSCGATSFDFKHSRHNFTVFSTGLQSQNLKFSTPSNEITSPLSKFPQDVLSLRLLGFATF